jgi:hypothetical protein
MNEYLNFWRLWSFKDKLLLLVVLVVLVLLMLYGGFSWWQGLENVLHWDVVSQLNEKTMATPAVSSEGFVLSTSSPVWYIKERYLPSLMEVNGLSYHVLLLAGLVGMALFLVSASRGKGLWFLVGTLFLAGGMVSFRLENVFLAHNAMPFLMAFAIFGLVFYLSNYFSVKITTLYLVLAWGLGFGLFLIFIEKASVINAPFLSISAYGSLFFLLITAIFIFFISHEIFAGVVWLVSKNGKKGQSSLPQFLMISALFFANLLLIYLENTKQIAESAFILPPIFIYMVSVWLGLWGFKKMIDHQQWFSFQQAGVWLYLGLAIISTATVGWAYATANDPMQELIDDYIVIGQIGVGLSFFVHVLINFLSLFKQGLEVQKVLYKSPFSRLLLARVAAFFMVILLFSFKNNYSYYQFQAGFNNSLADFYLKEGDLKAAETFYKASTHYDLFNHKANVALASLALSQNDRINAAFFFKQALEKKPSVYASMGLSASLENENMYFDAIFALQEAIKKFPSESRLYTNLAFLQSQAHLQDSVLLNLTLAKKYCVSCETENANLLAFWIENAKLEKLEEMENLTEYHEQNSYLANKQAIDKILGRKTQFDAFSMPPDSVLDVSRAALLFNALTNNQCRNETKLNAATIRNLQQKPNNDAYFEDLSWVYANQQYYRERKLEGIKQLTLLASSDLKKTKIYNQNLGVWLLNEGVYDQALVRLKAAGDTASLTALQTPAFVAQYRAKLQERAVDLQKKGISIENYKNLQNKSPLNPYLIANLCAFLREKNRDSEAYNLAFYASELNPNAPEIWENYILSAVKMAQFDYALEGLNRLKPLVSHEKYEEVFGIYEGKRESIKNAKF